MKKKLLITICASIVCSFAGCSEREFLPDNGSDSFFAQNSSVLVSSETESTQSVQSIQDTNNSLAIDNITIDYNSNHSTDEENNNDVEDNSIEDVLTIVDEEENNVENNEKPSAVDIWRSELKEKLELLEYYKSKSEEYELYCFFTDLHLYDNGGYGHNCTIMNDYIPFLQEAYLLSSADFIVCGGDLLNNGDTKSEACYKLANFDQLMKTTFNNYYFIVGNHDTNYQGNTYMESGNWNDCILSQETLTDILFDGKKSYYRYDTSLTTYYFFDTGIDWEDHLMTPYKAEQVTWFANDLLKDGNKHKVLFMHIPLNYEYSLTAFTLSISKIVNAYNNRKSIHIGNRLFNYSKAIGTIEFAQSGHFHKDLNNYYCGEVPFIVTTSFSAEGVASQPTFDFVLIDYSNNIVRCVRVGDGEDRLFNLQQTEA